MYIIVKKYINGEIEEVVGYTDAIKVGEVINEIDKLSKDRKESAENDFYSYMDIDKVE